MVRLYIRLEQVHGVPERLERVLAPPVQGRMPEAREEDRTLRHLVGGRGGAGGDHDEMGPTRARGGTRRRIGGRLGLEHRLLRLEWQALARTG